MRLIGLGVALLGALVLVSPAAAKDRYCSPTGDYCTSVARLGGVRYLRIGTFSFRGLVKICVTAPRGAAVCHSFRLRKAGEIYGTLLRLFELSEAEGLPTYQAADRLAEDRINRVGQLQRTWV